MSQTELSFALNNQAAAMLPKREMPRSYQQEAIDAIINVFQEHPRTHIVMACGTGKTRVALWTAEQLSAKNIVVFVPSLALIRQLMEEWLKVTVWPHVSCLAVCSDETVTCGVDNIIVDPKECHFPVTTEPAEIHQFLKKSINGVKIVFCTYHSSAALSEGMQNCTPFDYGVFDEAHKTAGRSYFGLGVDNQAIPIQKRLFMTATPKHCNINKKNQENEAKLVYSMDSEALYGPRAYTLSFRKAINLGIITDYKIMISVVNSQSSLNAESELDGKIVALRKAVIKDPNIAKVISFHQTIDEARAFSFHIQGNHDALPDFTNLHVNSQMTSHARHDIMRAFQKSNKSIISNARCLTEGIDVPAVDMVAFLNAKKSKIDIVQAIGRAMRKSPGKTYGYVFLPLFVEQNTGESVEEAILRADYEDIWEVVQAFSEQDEDLNATLEWLKQEKGKTGRLRSGLERYLEIISYDDVNISLQEQLKRVVSIAIIDKIVNNWHDMYGKLILFQETYHHTNVAESYQDRSLGLWVRNQRVFYQRNKLSKDRVQRLEDIGFEWDLFKTRWYRHYEALKAFKEDNNHCHILGVHKNKLLKTWTTNQRNCYKNGVLPENKVNLLNQIGFVWNLQEAIWNRCYEALKLFKETHNHCNVPVAYPQDKRLGRWVTRQKQYYKNDKLSVNKIILLEAIGFEWEPWDKRWHLHYEALKAFNASNNHCNVPKSYPQNKPLGHWVRVQRQRYRNGSLSANKIKLLEAIKFEWNPHELHWYCHYESLKAFKIAYNHCNVPQLYQENESLGKWVSLQRTVYKNNRLSVDKIKLLAAIGFEWDPRNASWHLQYETLKAFKKIYHHCNVPESYEDKILIRWVLTQRQLYKQKKLSVRRIKLLEAISFKWNPRDAHWDYFYEKLKAFKLVNNHCKIPRSYQDKSLVYWAARQRQKSTALSQNKIKLLNAIAFEWKLK